jgi:hypothetical protein
VREEKKPMKTFDGKRPLACVAVITDPLVRVPRNWLECEYRVEGERVLVTCTKKPDGAVVLHVAPAGAVAGHTVTLQLSRDAKGKTAVVAQAGWFTDCGPPFSGSVEVVHGTVRVRPGGWHHGHPPDLVFELEGEGTERGIPLRTRIEGGVHAE